MAIISNTIIRENYDEKNIAEMGFDLIMIEYNKALAEGWVFKESCHTSLFEITLTRSTQVETKLTRAELLEEAKADPKVIKLPPKQKGNAYGN